MKEDPVIRELREIRATISAECGNTMEGIVAFLKKKEKKNIRDGAFCPDKSSQTLLVAEKSAEYKVKKTCSK